ncbi:hypothetical protein CHARACLAT_030397 [Characodon lateralis]|uniref:Uncharacterized protein n=1 Tax=Characodon lateralis TaxID=208331 RepID=A0ABU7EQC8_9TELE|nr:hypothetical protein [Characodon lateralis]
MDRSVLLLLFSLQMFLLITAFSSADAAVLVTSDLQKQQTSDLGTITDVRRQRAKGQRYGCGNFIGGCSVITAVESTHPPALKAVLE